MIYLFAFQTFLYKDSSPHGITILKKKLNFVLPVLEQNRTLLNINFKASKYWKLTFIAVANFCNYKKLIYQHILL